MSFLNQLFALIALLVLVPCSACAQVLSTATLPIPGAVVFNGLKLEDDGALTVGALNGQLQLVRWTDAGDTVWTRTYEIPLTSYDCGPLLRLGNGDLLVAGRHLFDENGTFIETHDFGSNNAEVVGQDSLLIIRGDSMNLVLRDHTVLWQRPFACRSVNVPGEQHCIRSGSGLICYTGYHMVDDWSSGSGVLSKVYYSRYTLDGALIDTTRVVAMSAAPPVSVCRGVDAGVNGVLLAGQLDVSCCPVMIRTHSNGELSWVQNGWFLDWPEAHMMAHAPHHVLIRDNGRIMTFGISTTLEGEDYTVQIGLMEYTSEGIPICWEPIGDAEPIFVSGDFLSPLGFVYATSDDRLVAIGTIFDFELEPEVVWRSYGALCLSTGYDGSLQPGNSPYEVQVTAGTIQVMVPPDEGPCMIELFNSSGTLVFDGASTSMHHRFSTAGFGSGLYVLVVTDRNGERRAAHRVVLE